MNRPAHQIPEAATVVLRGLVMRQITGLAASYLSESLRSTSILNSVRERTLRIEGIEVLL